MHDREDREQPWEGLIRDRTKTRPPKAPDRRKAGWRAVSVREWTT